MGSPGRRAGSLLWPQTLQCSGRNAPPLLRVSVAGSGAMGAQMSVLGMRSVWWPGHGLEELIHKTRPSWVLK